MTKTNLWRLTTLLAYLGLIALILVWNTLIDPPERPAVSLVLIILLGPLLFPLRGLLHGRRYTHAWSSMLALAYFILGITGAYTSTKDQTYDVLMVILSLVWFAGAIVYVRTTVPTDKTTGKALR